MKEPTLEVKAPCLALRIRENLIFYIDGNDLTNFTMGKHSFKFALPPSIFVDLWKHSALDERLLFEFHVPVAEDKLSYVLTHLLDRPLLSALLADGRLSIPFSSTTALLLDKQYHAHHLPEKD